MIKSGNNKCYRCLACANICPKQAIKVHKFRWFELVKVDKNKCVHCGLCDKICIIDKTIYYPNRPKEIWALQNTNENVLKNSSSGGFINEIFKICLRQGFVVYGTCFDDDFKLIHKRINDIQSIPPFLKSKYIKSDTRNTFAEIKSHLSNSKKVLYVGTPCEISALLSFLGKNNENLFLIDFACHGTPSQAIFDKYKKEMEKKYKSKVISVDFRCKDTGWNNFSICIKFGDGSSYCCSHSNDPYLQLFLNNFSIYNSCYHCKFKGLKSAADFSIADFWGIEKINNDFSDDKGTSLVIVNTEKAKKLFDMVKPSFRAKQIHDYNLESKKALVMPPFRPSLGRIAFLIGYLFLSTSHTLFLCKAFDKIDLLSKRRKREYWGK